jgi:hypothetical protein
MPYSSPDEGVGRADPAAGSGLTGPQGGRRGARQYIAIASTGGAGTSLHSQLRSRERDVETLITYSG